MLIGSEVVWDRVRDRENATLPSLEIGMARSRVRVAMVTGEGWGGHVCQLTCKGVAGCT